MSELTVVLDRKEMVVTHDAGVLRVERPDAKPARIPVNMIREVIIVGSPMMSANVFRTLANRNIPVMLMPGRGRGEPAFLGPVLSGSVTNRVAQHRAAGDGRKAAAVARRLLTEKFKGQQAVLEELDADRGKAFARRIGGIRRTLETKNPTDRDRLMGYEGAAAAIYFQGVGALLPEKWGFKGRNRRPPKDPVNSLMSLSYAMAETEIRRAAQAKGLDPAVGFFHALTPGRDSLVLDVLEPLRPMTDRFAFEVLGQLKVKDFSTGKEVGCRMTKAGREIFFRAWAAWQETEDPEQPGVRRMAAKVLADILGFLETEKADL